MYICKNLAGKRPLIFSIISMVSFGLTAVSMNSASANEIFETAELSAEAEVQSRSLAGSGENLQPLNAAGSRGNLTELFKSPRRAAPSGIVVEPGVVASAEDIPLATLMGAMDGQESSGGMTALDAANSSVSELNRLWPDSPAGKFDAYRKHVLKANALKAEVEIAQTMLAEMDRPALSLSDLSILVAKQAKRKTEIQTDIAEIKTGLNAVGGVHDVLEAELSAARTSLVKQNRKLLKIAAAKEVAINYKKHADFVTTAERTLETCDEIANKLLADAAGRPITPELIVETHELMGLPIPNGMVAEMLTN